MADKEQEKEAEGQPKKSKLMPLIMVAVGAALGGGGVVVMTKPSEGNHKNESPVSKLVVVHHPDEMHFVFNPVKKRGSGTARIRFKFDYLVDETNVEDAFKAIKDHWDRANARCIEVLTTYSAQALKSPEGKRDLRQRLLDELTLEFFPEERQDDETKARVAVVDDILWTEFFLQN